MCGMTPEARRQLWFTVLLIAVSLNGTVMSTLEQRFVGHLGKDSMAARSISYSVIMYFYGISSMWAPHTLPPSPLPPSLSLCRGSLSLCRGSLSLSVSRLSLTGCGHRWAAISTKIGRAVGAKDYPAIGRCPSPHNS